MYLSHGWHFWAERIFERLEHSILQIEVSQIIIHKGDQPDVVVDFLDANGLARGGARHGPERPLQTTAHGKAGEGCPMSRLRDGGDWQPAAD